MASFANFHKSVSAHNVIAAVHAAQGGTNNFYFKAPEAAAAKPPEPFSTVPFPPDHDYIDRPEILEWVDKKCARPAGRVALVGLGGIGKSQLAIQYAHKVRERSPKTYVFWVHAGTHARFEESYAEIAERLELPRRDDPNINILQLVLSWLRNEDNGPWKMIVDNADDYDVLFSQSQSLASFLPQSLNGSILVTSRSERVAERLVGIENTYSVSTMEPNQAIRLLGSKLQGWHYEEDVEELARTLDGIPLAITQAAAFINRGVPRTSIPSYLDDMRRNDAKKSSIFNREAGDLRRDPAAANSIVATWQITFEQIRRESSSAANLLCFVSLFNPQGIPGSALETYSKTLRSDFDTDLEVLRSYALVSATFKHNSFEIHPLVKFCTKVWLSKIDDLAKWDRRFLHVMAEEFPNGAYETWAKCQELLPHLEHVGKTEPKDLDDAKEWAYLLSNIGWYLFKRGKYEEAELNCYRAVRASQNVPGDGRNLAFYMTNLATILESRGDYRESEIMHRKAIKIQENEVGPEHPDTLTGLNDLALCLSAQSKNKEAEKIHRRVHSIRERDLGSDHPETVTSLGNLGSTLRKQGMYREAEKIQRKVHAIRERDLGSDHPDTLTSLNNLAKTLGSQGDDKQEARIHRRVLEARNRVLGPLHIDTLGSAQNLGYALQQQRKYTDAAQLYQRAYDGFVEVFGADHPRTLDYLEDYDSLKDEMVEDTNYHSKYPTASPTGSGGNRSHEHRDLRRRRIGRHGRG